MSEANHPALHGSFVHHIVLLPKPVAIVLLPDRDEQDASCIPLVRSAAVWFGQFPSWFSVIVAWERVKFGPSRNTSVLHLGAALLTAGRRQFADHRFGTGSSCTVSVPQLG